MPQRATDDHPEIVICAGCGGKNPGGSSECDWCGRPFVSTGGRLRLTAWQILSSLLLLAVIGAVAALAYLNAGRALPVRPSAAATSTVAPTVAPTPVVTPRVTALTPTVAPVVPPTTAPTAPPAPTPEPSPTPPPKTAKIFNTNGQGVSVRQQPGSQSQRVTVLREGTTVLLTGNDQTIAARPWREIETVDHNLKGWVQGDFLQLIPTP
jgi:hypothetical protein